MTPRDQRLLLRLQASLDTLENDGEIAAVVRQIRRIRGGGAFGSNSTPPPDRLSLIDERPMVQAAMRKLGHTLRFAAGSMGIETESLVRLGEALAMGAQWAPGNEARAALACMACLLDFMRDQVQQQQRWERMRQEAANLHVHDLEALRQAMTDLADRTTYTNSTAPWNSR